MRLMARIARAVMVDYPHHITQRGKPAGSPANRGNNRQKVFFAQYTWQRYSDWLTEYAQEHQVDILAYCLMTNHVHLLVKPRQADSLAKMMQGLNIKYTRFINHQYHRTGRIWAGRFYSCIVDAENYLWAVARYIEQNPVRAGMVRRAEDYPYSSAPAHISGKDDDVLTEVLFPEAERIDYIKFVRAAIPDKEMEFLRYSTGNGKPLGKKSFIRRMEMALGCSFLAKPAGRPRNKGL